MSALDLDRRLGRAAELARVEELVAVQLQVDELLGEAVVACRQAGIEAAELARALGLSRATFYRKYPPVGRGRLDAPKLPMASELYGRSVASRAAAPAGDESGE